MTTPRAARRSPRTARRSPLPFPIWLRAYASFSVGGATAADVGSRADRKYVRCAFLAASERHGGQVWNPHLPVRCVGADRIADCPLQSQKTHLCSNVLSAPKRQRGAPRPHQRFRRRRFRPIRQTAAPILLQRLTMMKTTRRRRFRQANYSPRMARCDWTARSPARWTSAAGT